MTSKLVINGTIGIAALIAAYFGVLGAGYGSRLEFNGGEVFYIGHSTESEATRLGEYLAGDLEYFDGQEKSVQLDKRDKKIIVRFCVQDGAEENPEVETAFRTVQTLIAMEVFKDHAVEVQLCDEYFQPVKTLDARSDS